MELPQRYRVIETRIAAFDLDEAVDLFLAAPAAGARLRAHFCTTHTLVEASGNSAPARCRSTTPMRSRRPTACRSSGWARRWARRSAGSAGRT